MIEPPDIREIASDPCGATSLLAPKLQAEGVRDGPVPPRLRLVAQPVLRWMESNVALAASPAANVKVDKQKGQERVDGTVPW